MPKNWTATTIGKIVNHERGLAMGPFGSRIKTDNFVDSGVPIIRGKNLDKNRFREKGFVFVTPEKARELASAKAIPGDLVFTHRGTLGQVAIIPFTSKYESYLVSQSQMRARFDPAQADSRFLYYWFASHVGQAALLQNASQTGVPAISQPITSLRAIKILLPPLPIQRKIADFLSLIDELIETNEGISRQLLELGMTVVSACKPDRQYSLEELSSSIFRGITPRYSEGPNSVLVLNQKCIRDQSVNVGLARLMDARKVDSKRVAEPGDLLINSTGMGTLGRMARWLGSQNIAVDSHITVLKATHEIIHPSVFAYCMLWNEENIEALAEGSTGQTELSPSQLANFKLQIPRIDDIGRLTPMLEMWDDGRWALEEELHQLRQTRQELLPLLITGVIAVKDVAA